MGGPQFEEPTLTIERTQEIFTATETGADHAAEGHLETMQGTLDTRRHAQIANRGPIDHSGEVFVQPMAGFDIEKTIFKTLPATMYYLGVVPGPSYYRKVLEMKYSKEFYWSDKAVSRIEREVKALRETGTWNVPAHSTELIRFMTEECDFACEHADGSFLDHLQFCFEYGLVNYKERSAMPLFLHSIMGVGTNLFPMPLAKRDKLASLITADEMAHVEAFPTTLRLISTGVLMDVLEAMSTADLLSIQEFECYRLLGPDTTGGDSGTSDNKPLTLTGEQLWVHLNYHLVHFLDFLPVEYWATEMEEAPFSIFIQLHRTLTRAGKLEAQVQFDVEAARKHGSPDPSLKAWVKKQGYAVLGGADKMTKQFFAQFSGPIGHSLDFKLDGKAFENYDHRPYKTSKM